MSLHHHAHRAPLQRAVHNKSLRIGKGLIETAQYGCVQQGRWVRYGSSVPGPLEARRRATKRRMVYVAPAPTIPRFLDDLVSEWRSRLDRDGVPERQAEATKQPSRKVYRENDAHEEQSTSASIREQLSSSIQKLYNRTRDTESAIELSDYVAAPESQNPTVEHFITEAVACTNINDIREVNARFPFDIAEHNVQIFSGLLSAGRPLTMLLDFVVDSQLSDSGPTNLRLLLLQEGSQALSAPFAAERIKMIASWTKLQASLGLLSNAQIKTIIVFAKDIAIRSGSQDKRYQVLESIVNGIMECRVFTFEDVGHENIVILMDCLSHGPYSERMQVLTSRVLRHLKEPLLIFVRPSVSRCFLKMLSSLYCSQSSALERIEGDPFSFERTFYSLMNAIPDSTKLSFIDHTSEELARNHQDFNLSAWLFLLKGWWTVLERYNLNEPALQSTKVTAIREHSVLHLFAQHLTKYQLSCLILSQWCKISARSMLRIEKLLRFRRDDELLWITVQTAHAAGLLTIDFTSKLFGLLHTLGYSGAIINIIRQANHHNIVIPLSAIEETIVRHLFDDPFSTRPLVRADERLLIKDCP